MVALFQRERDTFTTLVTLLEGREIRGLIEVDHPPNIPVSRTDSDRIRAILTRVGVTHLTRDAITDEVTLVYDASWYAGTGWAKMYAHVPRSDLSWTVSADLDVGFQAWDKARPWRAERPLDGRWVLRLEYAP